MKYGKEKREKMMDGGMKRKPMKNGRMMYNKGGKAGSQPSYGHGEMPKCMPK